MTPKKPRHLDPDAGWTASAKRFWRDVHREFAIDEPQHRELLRAACAQLTRAETAGKAIDAEGVSILDRFDQVKENPMLAVERQAHLAFLRLAREMGLDVEPVPETRGYRRAGT